MFSTTPKILLGLAAASIFFAPCALAQQDQASPETDPRTWPWLAKVAGACWRSELQPGVSTDKQCFSVQFGKVVRVAQTIDTSQKGAIVATLTAESVYAWEPRQKRIRHIFWASDGAFESATGGPEGAALVLYLDREIGPDGTAPVRTVLRMVDRNRYKASREERRGGRWIELFSFFYERV
jgi:hypothetical protein